MTGHELDGHGGSWGHVLGPGSDAMLKDEMGDGAEHGSALAPLISPPRISFFWEAFGEKGASTGLVSCHRPFGPDLRSIWMKLEEENTHSRRGYDWLMTASPNRGQQGGGDRG